MSGLRIALPTGALFTDACAAMRAAGHGEIDPDRFERLLQMEAGGHRYIRVRPTDVPVYVEMGAADCGVVGKDVLWETDRECYELVDLHFGACRLVLAAPLDSPLGQGPWPPHLRVATKYPHAARTYFEAQGITAELIKLYGSVELAPLTGLADAILDITATGTTLRVNGLREIAEAGRSTARLIANRASLKTRSAAVNGLAADLRRAAATAGEAGAA